MNKIDASIEYEEGGMKIKEMLYPYNRKDEEENQIARSNAKLVFSPKFIPFYPQIKVKFNLSWLETIIYGFIDFYLSNNRNNRFYFTNKQLSEATGAEVSDVQISTSLKVLKDRGLLQCKYKMRAGGGKIRFIEKLNSPLKENLKFNFKKTLNSTLRKLKTNNNKINNNKINNNISKDILYKKPKKTTKKITKKKSNPEIDKLVQFLKDELRVQSLDDTVRTNRMYCWHLLRKIKKNYPGKDAVGGIKVLIKAGLEDKFHSKNITNFKYLFYNMQKIIKSYKADKNKYINLDQLADEKRTGKK